jgi:hypothetical protein
MTDHERLVQGETTLRPPDPPEKPEPPAQEPQEPPEPQPEDDD